MAYNYLSDLDTYKHLYQVFIEALPGSSLLPKILGIHASSVRTAWNLLLGIGAASTLISLILKRNIPILVAVVAGSIFLLGYSISPFYDPHIDRSHYVYARHLTYILPLLSFLAIYGLSRLRFSFVLLSFFIGLGAIGSISSMSSKSSQDPSNREAGWVLGTKLGHDPARLVRIADQQQLRSAALMEGMGWSIASTIIGSSRTQSERLAEFQKIRTEIPDRFLSSFNEGVKHAFSEGMRPKLDQSFQSLILETDNGE